MRKYGLVLDPIVAEKDYILGGFGSLGGSILQPDGQWTPWLPKGEDQYNFNFEPSACASFGTLNAVEILLRRIYTETDNFSDRFLAKNSNTTEQGNSPQTVAESLRKQGVCYELEWPITSDLTTWEKFYAVLPQSIKILATEFVAKFKFTHEYVGTTTAALKIGLQYSPLGVAVSAWQQGPDGLYISPFPVNHWCVLIGYVDKEYWLVYDSYDENGDFVKKLAWDYSFGMAKRYQVTEQLDPKSPSGIAYLVSLILSAFGFK